MARVNVGEVPTPSELSDLNARTKALETKTNDISLSPWYYIISRGTKCSAAIPNGTSGVKYFRIGTIHVTGPWANWPLVIEIVNRGRPVSTTMYVKFKNVADRDPGIESFYTAGFPEDLFLVKTEASTWAIYVKKTETNASCTPVRCHWGTEAVNVTWDDGQDVLADAPEDAVHSQPYTDAQAVADIAVANEPMIEEGPSWLK